MAHVLSSELNDCSFSLEIAGYEIASEPANEYDANWIVIRISAKQGYKSWSKTDPCLLTWEIEDLIAWLRGRYDLEPLLQFVEPSIEFFATVINPEMVHLKVTLSEKLLPADQDTNAITLELFVPPDELKKFSFDLDSELSRFPYRQVETPE